MDPTANRKTASLHSPLEKPLQDAIRLFTTLNIPYALIGGIAAMIYGHARFSEDIDFVAVANHQEILAASPDVMRACNFDASCTWKLYHSSGIDIDIWKDEHSDAIAARAKIIHFGDQEVRIAEVHDLIATKLRANRPRDIDDITGILKHTPIDETLLQSRVTSEQFAHYQSIKADQ